MYVLVDLKHRNENFTDVEPWTERIRRSTKRVMGNGERKHRKTGNLGRESRGNTLFGR